MIGGAGGLVGWLLVNAEHTESLREIQRPQLTVDILNEGETPEPNSSALPQKAETADHGAAPADGTDGHGQPAEGHGATAEAADGTPAKEGQGDGPARPAAPADGVTLTPIDPALMEVRDDLRLPIVAVDGRQPWSTYARPFNVDDTRPWVAVMVTNLGLNQRETDAAIQLLPGAVSLSFSPYAEDLDTWLEAARAAGHEVFMDLPLEPLDFPRDDPGPSTLLTTLSTADNLNRLEWVLGQSPGFVGVSTWMGSQFTTVEDAMMPVLEGLKERGVMLVDSRGSSRSIATELASSIQLPRAFSNRFLDATPSISSVDRALADLETVAQEQRVALGIARSLPVSIDRIQRWTGTLERKGVVLAPVSALADRQRLR
ncbi:divergent polysaccharide deacetylase family protein [Thalassobaculum sp. OXR-137]|uniref:divergent polysaccharide deacetylase family protein n=1 Tax=Thalassobaculum sp. OXR-137 TaxID=3100173 RepID=UPI002AC9E1D2|nr:divergent polysaccharide deacetylase family protein [Thalassobaculum sp. OXR-137]WPZ35040.1 divergent polysaccharide deacetylase family protein [Thalassobaculum sp. OXR-137]